MYLSFRAGEVIREGAPSLLSVVVQNPEIVFLDAVLHHNLFERNALAAHEKLKGFVNGRPEIAGFVRGVEMGVGLAQARRTLERARHTRTTCFFHGWFPFRFGAPSGNRTQ